jgi:hypothetical protein
MDPTLRPPRIRPAHPKDRATVIDFNARLARESEGNQEPSRPADRSGGGDEPGSNHVFEELWPERSSPDADSPSA